MREYLGWQSVDGMAVVRTVRSVSTSSDDGLPIVVVRTEDMAYVWLRTRRETRPGSPVWVSDVIRVQGSSSTHKALNTLGRLDLVLEDVRRVLMVWWKTTTTKRESRFINQGWIWKLASGRALVIQKASDLLTGGSQVKQTSAFQTFTTDPGTIRPVERNRNIQPQSCAAAAQDTLALVSLPRWDVVLIISREFGPLSAAFDYNGEARASVAVKGKERRHT